MRVLVYSFYHNEFLDPELLYGLKSKIGEDKLRIYRGGKLKSKTSKYNKRGDETDEEIDNYDMILIHYTAFRDKDFEKVLNKKTNTVKIFVDWSDDFFVRRIYIHPEIRYYLKRELYHKRPSSTYLADWGTRYLFDYLYVNSVVAIHDKWLISRWNLPLNVADKHNKKMIPFQLTTIPKFRESQSKKDFDISFIGHLTSPDRSRYLSELVYRDKEGKFKYKIITKTRYGNSHLLSKPEYEDIMIHSKAGLSLRGVGYDTYRYWEIPSYGVALFSQRIPLEIPNNFVDGESAIFFDGKDEMKNKIKKYITKSDEWKEIAKKGKQRFLKYHTPAKRVESILNLVKQQ